MYNFFHFRFLRWREGKTIFDDITFLWSGKKYVQIPFSKYTTFVQFSEGCHSKRSILMKYLKNTKRDSFERMICDSFKWTLESIFILENKRANYLRFVTIKCLDNGQLTASVANRVFSELLSLADRVQILHLPDINVNGATKDAVAQISQNLRELGKTMVLIKQPDDPFCIFSNEAITFKSVSEQQQADATCQLTDFEIAMPAEKELASAVGFIAAVYNFLMEGKMIVFKTTTMLVILFIYNLFFYLF